MIKNLIVTLTTGALLTATIATAAVCTMTRSGKTKLLPAVDTRSIVFEPETSAIESTEVTEPAVEVKNMSVDFTEPEITETPAASTSSKTPKKMSKKQSAKVNYTYGTSRYNNGEWTALMNVKEDDTAVIEIVHEMFDDNGNFFTDHWVITGRIDKSTGTLEYSGCVNTTLKYDRLGRHENKIYNNGTGIIRFSGNSFSWTDTFRNEAKNLKLTKRG